MNKMNMKKEIREMTSTARKTITYGLQFSIGILIIGIVLYYINKHTYGLNRLNDFLSIEIILSSTALFAEFIIGGFILDHFMAKTTKD